MKKPKNYVRILLAVMILALSGYSCVMADEEIKLSATTLRPGDFIKITANEPSGSQVEVAFINKAKQLQVYNNQYLGLIAASYYTAPGTYKLSVKITKDNQSYLKEFPIEVTKREFPEDRVVIEEKVRKTILTTGNEKSDSKKVAEAKQNAQTVLLPPLWEGKFNWPVQGKITTKFGLIRYMNDIEEGRHSGLDISAPAGTPVLTCNRGKVIFAGNLYITGLTVIVQHGLDLYTSYCHLSKITVREGDLVSQGETLGKVGMTGLATGPHLHLTIRVGDICVDPYLLLDKEISWNY